MQKGIESESMENYICDWSPNQVRRYDSLGILIDVFADSGNMQAPNSILIRIVQSTDIKDESNHFPNDYLIAEFS